MGIHYDYKSTRSMKAMEKQAKREKKLAEKKAKRDAKEGFKKKVDVSNPLDASKPITLDLSFSSNSEKLLQHDLIEVLGASTTSIMRDRLQGS